MSQNHEFESKKVDRKAVCCKCSSGLSGMFSKTGFQCRNCLAIFCKKCRNQPENAMGCGPPSGTGGAAAQPAGPDPVMEFYLKYVKRNNKGEMVVRGLPEEWKMLFKDAGVKPKELKDPKTASWLIGLMNDILTGKVGDVSASADGAAAGGGDDGGEEVTRVEALFPFEPQQEGDLQFNKGDIITLLVRFDNGWAEGEFNGRKGQFPFNYVKELPPEPKKAPPPPPVARPPVAEVAEAAPANDFPAPVVEAATTSAAPAPPPPPMPVAAPKPPPPPPAAKKGPAPPPPPSGSKPADAGDAVTGRGFSANDLASGASRLRKVEDTPAPGGKKELKDLTAAERTNMLDIISAAMNARRKDIDEEGGDDDDDGWDDEEDDW